MTVISSEMPNEPEGRVIFSTADVERAFAAESLLAFWVAAGVDACAEAIPVNRLRQDERTDPLARIAAPEAAVGQAYLVDASEGEAAALAAACHAARAAEDLEALAKAISEFDGCALKRGGARQAVFYRGAADAALVIIGEAPGAEEDARGEPFVGRAGRLLDEMLRHAGLADRCFITNTVFWRPPQNRTPTPAEQRVCAPFVERAIELVAPKLLLAVGAAAARALLGASTGILACRGRWVEWAGEAGEPRLPAMATLHPAFLLRQPEAKKKAWADLLAVADRLDRLERGP